MTCRMFLSGLVLSLFAVLATSRHAQAQAPSPIDPTVLALLASAPAAQVDVMQPPMQIDPSEPPGLVLRRSTGMVRSGSVVAAAAGGMLLSWAALLNGPPSVHGACSGAWTPIAMAGPLLVSSVVVLIGALRRRELQRASIEAWPLPRGRRAMRIFATAMGVLPVLAAGAYTNWEDHHNCRG